jgi:hypothetical protein
MPVVGGQATPVVGTGTSGYNGTVDSLCDLLSGNQVQVDTPGGVSVRPDGAILFADTGNNIVRAYFPVTQVVVDEAGVLDTTDCPPTGSPTGGFNGDGQWADDSELNKPLAVTATGAANTLFVVADTGNAHVRQLGPYPLPPSLSLLVQSGAPGTLVSASAVNFAPNDTVQLQFNGSPVDSKQADTGGTANLQFSVPDLADAQYVVVAQGKRGSTSASFSIVATSLSQTPGTPGATLTVSPRETASVRPTPATPTPTATGLVQSSATPTPSSTRVPARASATPPTPTPHATATPIPSHSDTLTYAEPPSRASPTR